MSPTVRRLRYMRALASLGPDHPRTQALLGRWMSGWAVPQRYLGFPSPAVVGWHRASGLVGYLNRSARAALARDRRAMAVDHRSRGPLASL